MTKDPAFLFYSSDFLTGTMTFTDDQVGKYIRLLCLQHQKGELSEKEIMKVSGNDQEIIEKFARQENGKFINSRLKIEVDKRKENAEKQRKKIQDYWDNKSKKEIPQYNNGNTAVLPLENENEIVNENENINTSKRKKRNFENFEKWSVDLLSDAIFEQMLMKENFKFTPDGLQKAVQDHLELFSRYPNMNPQTVGEFRHSVIYHIKEKLEEIKSKQNGRANKNKQWDINELYTAAESFAGKVHHE